MEYEDHIPFQYAFKESSIEQLDNLKLFTIFFRSDTPDVE